MENLVHPPEVLEVCWVVPSRAEGLWVGAWFWSCAW